MDIKELQTNCLNEARNLFLDVEDLTDNVTKRVRFTDIIANGEKSINRYGLTKSTLGCRVADIYCDADEAGDEDLRSCSYGALLVLYWYNTGKWNEESRSLHLDADEFYHWLYEAINDALYYRSWRPRRREHGLSGDFIDNPQYKPNEVNCADKSINYFCSCKRAKEYQAANKAKRKSNFANGGTLSIDNTFDEDGYSILDREGLSTDAKQINGIAEIVNYYLLEGKLVEALIIDGICHGDSFKDYKTKEVVSYTYTDSNNKEVTEEDTYFKYTYGFDPRKLVRHLNQIDEDFIDNYFVKAYKVSDAKELSIELKALNNTKLYKAIEKTIQDLRAHPEVLKNILN